MIVQLLFSGGDDNINRFDVTASFEKYAKSLVRSRCRIDSQMPQKGGGRYIFTYPLFIMI